MADKKEYEKSKHIEELIDQAEFMRAKLAESIEEMEGMSITIPYDNGGGQTGVRENPIYNAYNKLLKSYQSTINQLEVLCGKKETEKAEVINLVGNSKWRKRA